MSKRITTALLAVLAVVALAAPAAATTAPPKGGGFELDLELEIFDLHLTTACGGEWVFANVSGTYEQRVHRNRNGEVERLVETMRGEITWFIRDSEKSYTSELDSKTVVTFPEGVDFFKPAHITVTGRNAGSFPIGDGPPGHGKLVYDGFIYTVDFDDVPSWTTEGDPVFAEGNFAKVTERICAALA
jgi:hypothetical protein